MIYCAKYWYSVISVIISWVNFIVTLNHIGLKNSFLNIKKICTEDNILYEIKNLFTKLKIGI